jgi:hypothetical protein
MRSGACSRRRTTSGLPVDASHAAGHHDAGPLAMLGADGEVVKGVDENDTNPQRVG